MRGGGRLRSTTAAAVRLAVSFRRSLAVGRSWCARGCKGERLENRREKKKKEDLRTKSFARTASEVALGEAKVRI